MPKINFSSTVITDADQVDSYVQGLEQQTTGVDYKLSFEGSVTVDTFKVRYQISGANGTGFKIIYACKVAGEEKSAAKVSPVEEKILSNGYRQLTLTFKL